MPDDYGTTARHSLLVLYRAGVTKGLGPRRLNYLTTKCWVALRMMTLLQPSQTSNFQQPRTVKILYVMSIYVLWCFVLICNSQLVLVVGDDDDSDSGHKATGYSLKRAAINRGAKASPSGVPRSRIKSLKVKSEVLLADSPTIGALSVARAYDTDGLPLFAKGRWCSSFLPTLYACLGSATNPWRLHEDGSTFLISLQVILDAVYPKSGYSITLGDKIYSMVRTGHICL